MSSRHATNVFPDNGPQYHQQDALLFERPVDDLKRGDIMVRLPYRVRRELHKLAFEQETTVQKLMQDAINLLMVHHDRDPVI